MHEHLDTVDRLAIEFGRIIRRARRARRATQARVALGAGVSQSEVSRVERGLRPGVRLRTIADICDVLEIDLALRGTSAFHSGRRAHDPDRQQDAAHARCSAHVRRRLRTWIVEQEVEVRLGSARGFIDVLAFRSGTLLIGEIKTEIRDIGELQRTLNWYRAAAMDLAGARRWTVDRVLSCVFVLATVANDERIAANRLILEQSFPLRHRAVAGFLNGEGGGSGLVLIDPARRQRDWLISAAVDGRRSLAPYRDYRDFMTRAARAS